MGRPEQEPRRGDPEGRVVGQRDRTTADGDRHERRDPPRPVEGRPGDDRRELEPSGLPVGVRRAGPGPARGRPGRSSGSARNIPGSSGPAGPARGRPPRPRRRRRPRVSEQPPRSQGEPVREPPGVKTATRPTARTQRRQDPGRQPRRPPRRMASRRHDRRSGQRRGRPTPPHLPAGRLSSASTTRAGRSASGASQCAWAMSSSRMVRSGIGPIGDEGLGDEDDQQGPGDRPPELAGRRCPRDHGPVDASPEAARSAPPRAAGAVAELAGGPGRSPTRRGRRCGRPGRPDRSTPAGAGPGPAGRAPTTARSRAGGRSGIPSSDGSPGDTSRWIAQSPQSLSAAKAHWRTRALPDRRLDQRAAGRPSRAGQDAEPASGLSRATRRKESEPEVAVLGVGERAEQGVIGVPGVEPGRAVVGAPRPPPAGAAGSGASRSRPRRRPSPGEDHEAAARLDEPPGGSSDLARSRRRRWPGRRRGSRPGRASRSPRPRRSAGARRAWPTAPARGAGAGGRLEEIGLVGEDRRPGLAVDQQDPLGRPWPRRPAIGGRRTATRPPRRPRPSPDTGPARDRRREPDLAPGRALDRDVLGSRIVSPVPFEGQPDRRRPGPGTGPALTTTAETASGSPGADLGPDRRGRPSTARFPRSGRPTSTTSTSTPAGNSPRRRADRAPTAGGR